MKIKNKLTIAAISNTLKEIAEEIKSLDWVHIHIGADEIVFIYDNLSGLKKKVISYDDLFDKTFGEDNDDSFR